MTQCYYNDHIPGQRCKNEAAEEDGELDCWCSEEHRALYRKQNYINIDKEFRRKPTIEEMQEKLLEIGKRVGDRQRKLI